MRKMIIAPLVFLLSLPKNVSQNYDVPGLAIHKAVCQTLLMQCNTLPKPPIGAIAVFRVDRHVESWILSWKETDGKTANA